MRKTPLSCTNRNKQFFGAPVAVWNRDIRAGGVTEGDQAGASLPSSPACQSD